MNQLKETLKIELEKYTGEGANCFAFPIFDNERQIYAVNVIDYPIREDPAGVILLTRILEDKIIIEEDVTDKKLVDALLQQGIPRDQIILAYAGEKAPIPDIIDKRS